MNTGTLQAGSAEDLRKLAEQDQAFVYISPPMKYNYTLADL